MPQFRVFDINKGEIDKLQQTFQDLAYSDLQHWLLDMIRLTILDKIDFYMIEPRRNLQTETMNLSVNLSPEYMKRANKAIKDAGFHKRIEWLLACIDWTLNKV